jgi:hypothetical protein
MKWDTQHNSKLLLCLVSFMLTVTYAEYHLEAPSAECHYAECRYAECRGTEEETCSFISVHIACMLP